MARALLPERGKTYKANLHMHTTISDGTMTPEEVKRAYLAHGYSIVAFTDHEAIVPHPELTDENFLALTAFEIAVNAPHPKSKDFSFLKTCHMNFFAKDPANVVCPAFNERYVWTEGTRPYITDEMRAAQSERVFSGEGLSRTIELGRKAGFLVSLNHPVWSGMNYADLSGIEGLWGVEVFNTGCTHEGQEDTVQPLDDLLRQGKRVLPLATDDAHFLKDCFGGYTMLSLEQLTYADAIRAMEWGDLYASTAPAIESLVYDDGFVEIATSPAAQIVLTTERRFACRAAAQEAPLHGARFDLRDYLDKTREAQTVGYFRITVKDGAGRCAWTRAYFTDEI